MKQKVSIIVPVYNRANIIGETIASVIRQRYTNWEMLVVDDHSTDNTRQVVANIAAGDARIKWIEAGDKRKGAPASRNVGMRLATGELIMFLDSDDLLISSALENRVGVMAQHPQNDFAVFPSVFFTEHPGDATEWWNVLNEQDDLDRFLVLDVPWTISGPIWRKSFLDQKRLVFDEEFQSNQDWEFHVRALLENPVYTKHQSLPDNFIRRNRNTPTISIQHQSEELTRNRIELMQTRILPKIIEKHGGKAGRMYFAILIESIRALNRGLLCEPFPFREDFSNDEAERKNLWNTYRYFKTGKRLNGIRPFLYNVFRRLLANKMFDRNFYGSPNYRTRINEEDRITLLKTIEYVQTSPTGITSS